MTASGQLADDDVGSAASAAVVARQLDAYNAKDLDAFIACWGPDATFVAWPGRVLAEGTRAIRERHQLRFQEPSLNARLQSRLALGEMVVDHELVDRDFPDGPATVEVIAIYEVRDGLIRSASFMQGPARQRD